MDTIEDNEKARSKYGYAYGATMKLITQQDIEALQNGKCLAFGVNGFEYVVFISMRIDEDE
jgi:hypothetical protein